MSNPLLYSHQFLATGGQCNAGGTMSLPVLVQAIIDVATEHANALNIGFERLRTFNAAWVLSRLSIQMDRWPGVNEEWTMTTWIENWNRLYSDRVFEITDAQGNVIGNARTAWVAIDVDSRTPADLTQLHPETMIYAEKKCPVPRMRKLLPVALDTATVVRDYQFLYTDIDVNGHVNSVRYVEHILNLWPPALYAKYPLCGFEIAYIHECFYDQRVAIAAIETQPDDTGTAHATVDILRDGERAVAAAVTFRKKS